MKQKGFAPILIILILFALGIAGYVGYKQFYSPNQPTNYSPSPSPSPTPDPTANWKTYTNTAGKFSFKYPPTWTIDTSGDKGDDRGENIQVKLTSGQAKISIWAKMMGIGGMGQNYQGTPVTFAGTNLYRYKALAADDKTVIIGLTDQLTESLGVFRINGETYDFSLEYPKTLDQTQAQELENEFDLIFSTFKFTQ